MLAQRTATIRSAGMHKRGVQSRVMFSGGGGMFTQAMGQEYNEKVFSDFTPSILHGVLVGACFLWSARSQGTP